jgi:hypothetical protein
MIYRDVHKAFHTDRGVTGARATKFNMEVNDIRSRSAASFVNLASASSSFLLFATMQLTMTQTDLVSNCRPV